MIDQTPKRTGLRRFAQSSWAVGRRNLHNFFGNPALSAPTVAFPLFFFAAFAGGLSNVQNVPGFDYPNGYTTFQFGFVLMQAAAFGGVFAGFSMARDFENGFTRRLMLAMPHRSAIVVGYWIAAAARAVVVLVVLFGVGLATGLKVTGGAGELALLVALALMVNLLALLFASGVAMRLRTIHAGPLMQTPVFMALFLTPVYVPFDLLHGWVKSAADINPLTEVIEASRTLLAGATTEVVAAFGLAAAVAVVFLVWSITGLRRAERAGG